MEEKNNPRIWLDRLVLNYQTTREYINNLTSQGYTLVVTNSLVDVKLFQKDPAWFCELADRGHLVVEMNQTIDQMASKPFYWDSVAISTIPCKKFKDVISMLPNRDEISILSVLVELYGIPKSEWYKGPYGPIELLSDAEEQAIGVSSFATRSEILIASKKLGFWPPFDNYNKKYVNLSALQHHCEFILTKQNTLITPSRL